MIRRQTLSLMTAAALLVASRSIAAQTGGSTGQPSSSTSQSSSAASGASANNNQAAPAQSVRPVIHWTPLRFVVTVSRYQGDRRVSSVPYTLSVNAPDQMQRGMATLRNTTKIAVANGSKYEELPTNIDVMVFTNDNSTFRVELTLNDSAVVDEKPGASPMLPTIRSLSMGGSSMMKDGQTALISTTPDKVTGEIVRVEVNMAVVK